MESEVGAAIGLIDSIGIGHGCFRTKGKWICALQTQKKTDQIAPINMSMKECEIPNLLMVSHGN
ncbi:MAG: hypothetical protein DLM72_19845 [Candidatus Nitrosopolaris wilkensis]|nr:MAG: hypothetical protein DLM72_19845 [Candidatus Nitrosopolaris wilkensis]